MNKLTAPISAARRVASLLLPLSDEAVRERVDSMIAQAQASIHHAGCGDPRCEVCGSMRQAATEMVVSQKDAIAASMRDAHRDARLKLLLICWRVFDTAAVVAVLVLLIVRH